MKLLTGTYSRQWGHTWLTSGNGKLYAAVSTAIDAALAVFDPEDSAGPSPALSIDMHGRTTPCGRMICRKGTAGIHPCHITLLPNQAITSDYTSGSLTVFELDGQGLPCPGARLLRFPTRSAIPDSINAERQSTPHIHSSWVSPDGNELIVVDLGSDRLYVLPLTDGRLDIIDLDENGFVLADFIQLPAGCGPRHCTFGNSMLYVSTELSDEVLVLSWPGKEMVQRIGTNGLHPGGGGHLALSPDGKFLYVSSRLNGDGIAVFAVDGNGLLHKTAFQRTGLHPRHFCLSDDGKILAVACRDSNTVEIYVRNPTDGLLSLRKTVKVEKPVFVEFIN